MTIESKGYVVSAKDIEDMCTARLGATVFVSGVRQTYLRCLIATAQSNLGIEVHRVNKKQGEQDASTTAEHAAALEQVHAVFYEAVLKVARSADMSGIPKDARSRTIGSHTGFARSAYSVVRNWLVRGKHTLYQVRATSAEKRLLFEDTPKAAVRHPMARDKRFKRTTVIKRGNDILGAILVAAKTDREEALKALQDVITLLSRGFDDLGLPAVDIRDAVEHTATGVIHEVAKRLRRAA